MALSKLFLIGFKSLIFRILDFLFPLDLQKLINANLKNEDLN